MRGSPDGPRWKIERAKQHVDDLQREVRRFLDSNPYEVVRKDDKEGGGYVCVLIRVEPVPPDVAVIAGDAIHNARSALDLLVCQLVLSNGTAVARRDAFPISDSPEQFESGGVAVIEGRVSDDALRAIREVKPYKGGNDGLWRLHKLDIADKHRLLLTAGSAYAGVSPPLTIPDEEFRAVMEELVSDLMIVPANRAFPLQVGTELLRIDDTISTQPHIDPKFTFEVALGESGIVEGEAIVETLAQLVGVAEETTEILIRLL